MEFALQAPPGSSPVIPLNAARQLASARCVRIFHVVVAPALPLSTVLADPRGRWQPVAMPGSDSRVTIIRWDRRIINVIMLIIRRFRRTGDGSRPASKVAPTPRTLVIADKRRRLPDNT